MGVAEREREKARLFVEMVPEILEDLAGSIPSNEIAAKIAERRSMDLAEAYRWVLRVEDDLERLRRRHALPGIVLLWVGGGLLAGAIVLFLLPEASAYGFAALGAAVLGFLGAWGLLRGLASRVRTRYLRVVSTDS